MQRSQATPTAIRAVHAPAAAARVATAVAVAGALVAAAFASSASAQTPVDITAKVKVTPNKAGTKKKPRGVRLNVQAHWRSPEGFEKPVITRAIALFPKGSLYNGGKFPRCTQRKLDNGGPPQCPKASIMGRGGGNAYADTVITKPSFTVVNGGAKRVYLHTVLRNPALVSKAVPGFITKRKGRWAYQLRLVVPRSLQIVAGVPIALRDFNVTAGKRNWLATTSCPPSRKWPFRITTYYNVGGSTTFNGTTRCRR